MRALLRTTGRVLALTIAYLVLFTLGASWFAPEVPPADASSSLGGLVVMALLDSALFFWFLESSALVGVRLALVTSGLIWGVKSFTSGIEAAYFMPNVGLSMLDNLLLMTLPLALGLPPIGLLLLGKWTRQQSTEPVPSHGLTASGWPLALRISLLSAVVYPALFILAGWYIAFASPEVVAFYGGQKGPTLFAHVARLLSETPTLYPFEVFRGLLWVLFALPFLLTVRGTWYIRTLQAGLWFAIVQNDVHLLPNPLMPQTVRMVHFIETASSNFLWAFCIGYALSRVPRPAHA